MLGGFGGLMAPRLLQQQFGGMRSNPATPVANPIQPNRPVNSGPTAAVKPSGSLQSMAMQQLEGNPTSPETMSPFGGLFGGFGGMGGFGGGLGGGFGGLGLLGLLMQLKQGRQAPAPGGRFNPQLHGGLLMGL